MNEVALWLKEWGPAMGAAGTLLAFLVVPFGWWVVGSLRGGLATQGELTAAVAGLQRRMDEAEAAGHQHEADDRVLHAKFEHQLDRLSGIVSALPSAASLSRIEIQLAAVQGEVVAIRTQVSGLEKIEGRMQGQLDRLDLFLRDFSATMATMARG